MPENGPTGHTEEHPPTPIVTPETTPSHDASGEDGPITVENTPPVPVQPHHPDSHAPGEHTASAAYGDAHGGEQAEEKKGFWQNTGENIKKGWNKFTTWLKKRGENIKNGLKKLWPGNWFKKEEPAEAHGGGHH